MRLSISGVIRRYRTGVPRLFGGIRSISSPARSALSKNREVALKVNSLSGILSMIYEPKVAST
jgi:hypothetical protein